MNLFYHISTVVNQGFHISQFYSVMRAFDHNPTECVAVLLITSAMTGINNAWIFIRERQIETVQDKTNLNLYASASDMEMSLAPEAGVNNGLLS